MTEVALSWTEYEKRIQAASSVTELDAIEQELFGRKHGVLTLAIKELQGASEEILRDRARILNQAKQRLLEALSKRRMELSSAQHDRLAKEDPIDVTLELPTTERGHLHLIPEFIRHVEEIFGRMGFEIAEGPEIETEELNFNLLNMPPDHPARDQQATFWIKVEGAKERYVLRTHTSPVQIRYMRTHKPPFRVICPGRVYRRDADATHSPMFHQFEGLMIGEDVSLANMKAVMTAAIRELIAPNVEFRFRTSYFPFVEPGLEVDIRWQGDKTQSREGEWLEIVGCGMVHPQVLKNCRIDPKKWQGFAFGFGIERMIMIKHQIPDLRLFYEGDTRFLREF